MKKLCITILAIVPVAFASCGALSVKFGSAMEVIEGGVTNTYAVNETFTPTAVPCVYKMRPALSAGERTYCIASSLGGGWCSFPRYGEDEWVRIALAGNDGDTITLTGYKARAVRYVDADRGRDNWDGTADFDHRDETIGKGPKQSLQAANDAVTLGQTLVLVAPGVYSSGITNVVSSTYACKRRLYSNKSVGFIATGGAENTFIVGAPDPSTGRLGADAVSGVQLDSQGYQYLQGFTITGCYSPATQGNIIQYGTAVLLSSTAYTLDCVISNNYAQSYPVGYSGTYMRTKILENETQRWLSQYGSFVSCVIAGNRITYGNQDGFHNVLALNGNFFFCTINLRNSLNPGGRYALAKDSDSKFFGSMVYGYLGGQIAESSSFLHNVITDNPVFADEGEHDYRLGMLSPAIDAVPYGDMTINMRRRAAADVDGRGLVLNDGRMRAGAVWNEPAMPVSVVCGVGGGISVSDGREGTNVVTSAEPITVSATSTATRPFAGIALNGEIVTTDTSYTFTPSMMEGSVTTVKAVYGKDWYVDCANGNDASGGGSVSNAKKTIRAVTDQAVAGDTIHVAPGTYGVLEGVQTAESGGKIGTRVVVPGNVTLESMEGAERTFIVGAAATGEQVDNATYGTGTNAVRCVYAKSGAVVRGFTLTGGRGIGSGVFNASDPYGDAQGAAFYSAGERTATIEDCVVSNNAARSATIYQAIVRRCRVLENTGVCGEKCGAAGSECRWIGSVIDKNKGHGTVYMTYSPALLESCTIGTDNVNAGGSSIQDALFFVGRSQSLLNSAVLGGRLYLYDSSHLYSTNSLIASTHETWTRLYSERLHVHDTIFTNDTGAVIDVNTYSPVFGSFAGIDQGNAAFSSETLGEMDAEGTPRILNGEIDMGAVEYDWRPKFAAELYRRFTMTYASPSVTTNASGGVRMLSGSIAGLMPMNGTYEVALDITGGSFAVFVGGILAGETSAEGEQRIRFDVPDVNSEVCFVFTSDVERPGLAILKRLASDRGFILRFM